MQRPHRFSAARHGQVAASEHSPLKWLLIVLILAQAACRSGTGKGQAIPLQIIEGKNHAVVAIVPVYIKDQGPFTFALDTGASQSLVDGPLAEQLDLPVVGKPEEVSGIIGSEKADLIGIDNWRAGNVSLPASRAISITLATQHPGQQGLQGLLGSDVLSQFGSITIDYAHSQLTLPSGR